MRTGWKAAVLLTVLIASATVQIRAQGTATDEPIKVSTVLVNVPVVVSDRQGRNVDGLTKDDFLVTQDGTKQTIEFFANNEGSMNVAIVIDTSGSTAAVLGRINDAAKEFAKELGAEDKAVVVSFDSSVRMLLSSFTSDKGRIRGAINNTSISVETGSVMNDAVYRLVKTEFAEIKGRKAIIVLTDGDVSGKIGPEELHKELTESDILVYPIFFQTRRLLPAKVKSISFAELVKLPPVNYLNSLATVTGGRLYAANGNDFAVAFQNIASELKKQYVIGFYPTKTTSRDQNRVNIEVRREGLSVRSRPSIGIKSPIKAVEQD